MRKPVDGASMPGVATLPANLFGPINALLRNEGKPCLCHPDLSPDDVRGHYEQLLNEMIEIISQHQFSRPVTRQIYVRLLESNDIGAWVAKYQDMYVLAINAGCFGRLFQYFLSLLQIPELRSLLDLSPRPIKNWTKKEDAKSALDFLTGIDWSDRVDEDGSEAFILSKFSLTMLIYHEYWHAIAGHLDLKENISTIEGFGKDDLSLTLLALEYDADSFGGNYRLDVPKFEEYGNCPTGRHFATRKLKSRQR